MRALQRLRPLEAAVGRGLVSLIYSAAGELLAATAPDRRRFLIYLTHGMCAPCGAFRTIIWGFLRATSSSPRQRHKTNTKCPLGAHFHGAKEKENEQETGTRRPAVLGTACPVPHGHRRWVFSTPTSSGRSSRTPKGWPGCPCSFVQPNRPHPSSPIPRPQIGSGDTISLLNLC